MSWKKKAGQAGLGWLFGMGAQHMLGGSEDQSTEHASTYRREQMSNRYYPPGQSFMGFPMWLGGNLLSRVMPEWALRFSVQNLSKPSNPQTDLNRQLLPFLMGGASLLMNPLIGGMMRMVSGGVLGSEQVAQRQGRRTRRGPRKTNLVRQGPELQNAYRRASTDYQDQGYAPQGYVMDVMDDATDTDAAVSDEIYQNVLQTKKTPFQRAEQQ